MLIDRSVIGSTSETRVFEVEKGAIRAFAHAIGDENPLYTDEDFARQHGYKSIVAPPTFPTTFRIPIPNLTFELSRVLHGEQEYSYNRPIVAGDVLRCENKVIDVYERTGKLGAMTFLVTEMRGWDLEGNPVFRGKSTAILR
ncbi:MaoC family dehydratase N-terminal domain-containing protein [Lihuaxuella thermophila]|uniref:Acyl dehydratase n=1 Tax=Lihuaxuella thermophila TaxID=1173111 RepID=A0A1H8GFI1_9BACL|nr:MaoC family dehydratase N-terminal domain-containing protein [Lihuaxuella thermophila]SEN42786.1 Acyl dehydratase [Lihuaxuella thermophila]